MIKGRKIHAADEQHHPGISEKTYIYRLNLMTDAELMEEERTSVREIKELRHSIVMEYMKLHLYTNYDEPRTVTLRLHRKKRG